MNKKFLSTVEDLDEWVLKSTGLENDPLAN
jgi:hypothetical protein